MKTQSIKAFVVVYGLLLTAWGHSASAGEIPKKLPRPDGKPADQNKPVKVYIMMGQSNMLGFGRVNGVETKGSLEYLVKTKGKYPHLVDDTGKWSTRMDVRNVHVMDQRGVDYKNMEKYGDVRNE